MKWYELFDLDPRAVTLPLLKKRRNLLAKEYHEDGTNPDHNIMVRINKAYEEGETYIKERDKPTKQTIVINGQTYVYNQAAKDYLAKREADRWRALREEREIIEREIKLSQARTKILIKAGIAVMTTLFVVMVIAIIFK